MKESSLKRSVKDERRQRARTRERESGRTTC
jgi:hypothetical protein